MRIATPTPLRALCLPAHRESDPSHNVNPMVQATNEELLAHYGAASWFAIQWHGMGADTCPTTDVHLSHGRDDVPPDTKIAVLRAKLLQHNPTWDVSLPGSGSCGLNATENMQGRLINCVAAERVCCTPASGITQKFIHIEQHTAFRSPSDWIAPVTDGNGQMCPSPLLGAISSLVSSFAPKSKELSGRSKMASPSSTALLTGSAATASRMRVNEVE